MLDAERFAQVLLRFDLDRLRSHVAPLPIAGLTRQSYSRVNLQ